MSQAPVAKFLDDIEELIRLGNDFAGAMFTEGKVTASHVGKTECPFCGYLVTVNFLVGTDGNGTVRSGVVPTAPCPHGDMLMSMVKSVEGKVDNGGLLPERPT